MLNPVGPPCSVSRVACDQATYLDEVFQRFDVLGFLLGVGALLGFVRQRLFRYHLSHAGVTDGRHEVIFDVILFRQRIQKMQCGQTYFLCLLSWTQELT